MKRIFLSYCTKDTSIVDHIEDGIKSVIGNMISISRYDRDVHHGESIKKFMKSLSEHDYVLMIISDSYLKSDGCLYEVGELIKENNYREKMLFIVLKAEDVKWGNAEEIKSDNVAADIYNFDGRVKYLEYWKNIDMKETERLTELGTVANKELIKHYEMSQKRLFFFPIFLEYICDIKSLSLDDLIAMKYMPIIERIIPKYRRKVEEYNDLQMALSDYIRKVSDITQTDYNQIILKCKNDSHSETSVVVADRISKFKQHYRKVHNEGVISKSIDENKVIVVNDVDTDSDYMTAVLETKSELVVPIIFNNVVIGAINSEAVYTKYYSKFMKTRLLTLAAELAIVVVNLGYWKNLYDVQLPYVTVEIGND